MTDDLQKAHTGSTRHRRDIERSAFCGCFCCERVFNAADITEWIDEDQTAMCPRCGIDSVLGSANCVPFRLNGAEFLARMSARWFGSTGRAVISGR